DTVIARQLALHPQTAADPPDSRMHPVERASDRTKHLNKTVVAREMRYFMQEHGAPSIVGPGVGNGRNHDHSAPNSECHWHGFLAAAKQLYRLPETNAFGALEQ